MDHPRVEGDSMAVARRVCPFCGTRFERVLDPAVGELLRSASGREWIKVRHSGPTTKTGTAEISHGWTIHGYVCPKCGEHSTDLEHKIEALITDKAKGLKRDEARTE